MKVWVRFSILLTISTCFMSVSIAVAMRWVVIDAVQQQSFASKEIIARTLSDRVADFVLTGDRYSVDEALIDAVWVAPDIEYIYVTSLDGLVFSHTFEGGYPDGMLLWNPLNGRKRSVQLLSTEKGFINDIGISIFGSSQAQIHLGVRDTSLKKSLAAIRKTILAITILVILLGATTSLLISRALTRPLHNLVNFSQQLARGEFGASIPGSGRDEIGQLVTAFNVLSVQLADNRRQMEEAYKRMCIAEKLNAMSRLSAGLAHELRNPLTAIKVLFNSLGSPEEITLQDLEMVKNELSHMDGVLKRFLGVSRSDTMDMRKTDINTLVSSVLSLLRLPMKNQAITLSFFPEELPLSLVNAPLIEQAFLNLFINAIEAMEHGGTLAICTHTRGNNIVITIEDTGTGIPPEIKEKVFEPFVTSKKEGTGLGLFLVRTVIANHKGDIEYSSSPTGTLCAVTIPVTKEGIQP